MCQFIRSGRYFGSNGIKHRAECRTWAGVLQVVRCRCRQEGRNPKAEGRKKSEGRNPKFQLRHRQTVSVCIRNIAQGFGEPTIGVLLHATISQAHISLVMVHFGGPAYRVIRVEH